MAIKISKDSFDFHNINFKVFLSRAWYFWVKYFQYVLLLFFLIGLYYVCMMWYKNIYNPEIAGQDRSAEIQMRKDRVRFNSEDFEMVKTRSDARQAAFMSDATKSRDIFFPIAVQEIPEDLGEDVAEISDANVQEVVSAGIANESEVGSSSVATAESQLGEDFGSAVTPEIVEGAAIESVPDAGGVVDDAFVADENAQEQSAIPE